MPDLTPNLAELRALVGTELGKPLTPKAVHFVSGVFVHRHKAGVPLSPDEERRPDGLLIPLTLCIEPEETERERQIF